MIVTKTVIRYCAASQLDLEQGLPPVTVCRWRFIERATCEEVCGGRGGVDWVNQWTCETLRTYGWSVNGRGGDGFDPLVLDGANKHYAFFSTFDAALAVARATAVSNVKYAAERLARAEHTLEMVKAATAPELP